MSLRLTPGSPDDLDQVIKVMTAAFPEPYGEAWTRSQCAGILPMAGVALIVARDGGESAIGFSLFRTIAGDSELLLLAVDPLCRRQGIGRSLLNHFIAQATKDGASRIHLEVRDGNPATRIYEAAGFEQVNRRRNYYRGPSERQFDALTFVLAAKD